MYDRDGRWISPFELIGKFAYNTIAVLGWIWAAVVIVMVVASYFQTGSY